MPNSGTMTPTYEVPPGPELPDDLTHEASFIALGTVTTTETFEHQNTSFTLVTFSDLHTLKGLSGKTKVVFAFQREPDVGVPAFHLNDRGVGIVRSDQVHARPGSGGECVSLIARFSSQLSSQTSSLSISLSLFVGVLVCIRLAKESIEILGQEDHSLRVRASV